jgi:hypothetical protein
MCELIVHCSHTFPKVALAKGAHGSFVGMADLLTNAARMAGQGGRCCPVTAVIRWCAHEGCACVVGCMGERLAIGRRRNAMECGLMH